MKFLVCETCGNFVSMVKDSGVSMVCCGKKMTELIPGTSDGAYEKHVPVYKVTGNRVIVDVGATPHPMTEEHYIEWIVVETKHGHLKTDLKPGDAPHAEFLLSEGDHVVAVYAYCNLHSLWAAE